MLSEGLRTLLLALEVVRPALTEPGFRNFTVVFAGWVQTRGTHAITEALVMTNVAGRLHHERFHRFFSRGAWRPDELALLRQPSFEEKARSSRALTNIVPQYNML